MYLGTSSPHPAFLPLLRAVIENDEESRSTRYRALTAASMIPHPEMVEYLIEQLDTDLDFRAWQQLRKMTSTRIYNDTGNWQDVKRAYETWWTDHKDTFVYDRSRMMIEN